MGYGGWIYIVAKWGSLTQTNVNPASITESILRLLYSNTAQAPAYNIHSIYI